MSAATAAPPAPSSEQAADVDRSSPVPYYEQLKQVLRADIARRGLAPGDRLPGDHELCERHGLSRTVVRQALADLAHEGVVERVKGRGTFVAPPRTSQRLVASLAGLHEDLAASGRRLRSDVRRLEVAPADARVAAHLQLPAGAPVVVLERLRFVDEEPWVHTVSHLPAALVPGLVDLDLREQSLYALLEARYGVRLLHGRRTVEAHGAGARLAADLGIAHGGPVLTLTSTSWGEGPAPVETFVAHHRADRSRFEVELQRSPR